MRIDNLVFNKIGNSISVMIFSEDGSLQLLDETDFLYKSIPLSLKGLTAKDYLELYIEIIIKNQKIETVLKLDDKGGFLKVGNKRFPLKIGDGELLITVSEPNLAFKLPFEKFNKISVDGELIKISENNFLKGILEFIEFLERDGEL